MPKKLEVVNPVIFFRKFESKMYYVINSFNSLKASTLEHAKWFANCQRTKCAYVWTGLRTCAVPSTKSSHTIGREPKFVDFLRKHKENSMRRVSFVTLRFVEN